MHGMSWQIVRTGSAIEVNFALGHLEDAGIPTRVLDANGDLIERAHLIPVEDPVRLAVPALHAGRAEELLEREMPAIPRARPRSPLEAAQRAAEDLGRRIRWAAVSPFAPIALVLAPVYALRVRRAGSHPKDHAWTLAGIVVSALHALVFVWIVTG